jgi:hypothetical protein
MARELILHSPEDDFRIKFTHIDIQLLQRLPVALESQLSTLMTGKQLRKMSQDGILSVINELIDHINSDTSAYSYYGYRFLTGPCADDAVCSGRTSGLIILGDPPQRFREIEGGISSCTLRLVQNNSDTEEITLSDGDTLETNIGTITVVYATPEQLLEKLNGAASYLRTHRLTRAESF